MSAITTNTINMSTKRTRDADDAVDAKKPTDNQDTRKRRKGFTVGPQNLPDGTYRRKGIYTLR